jgi:hypothetical protein
MNTTTGQLHEYRTADELEAIQAMARRMGQEVVPVSHKVAETMAAGTKAISRQQRRLRERQARKAQRR